MSRTFNIMTGAAGLAAVLTIASPAAAQQPYPSPYANNGGGVVGAIINSVTGGAYGQYPQTAYGYGQYPQGNYGYNQVNDRSAVGMCVAATEQRINATYRGQPGYNNGYNNGYGQNGYANNGYQNGYNGQMMARVLGVTNVERRGPGSLKVSGVATSGHVYGYNNQGYNNQGYNNGYNGQRGYQANQTADLRFTCKVNARGQVSDVNINRNRVAYRGY